MYYLGNSNLIFLCFPGVSESLSVSPGHVIPLKRQQGFLNLLRQMLTSVGQNMEHYLDQLFPILLNLATITSSLLDQRSEVQTHSQSQGLVHKMTLLTKTLTLHSNRTLV